MEDEFSEKAMNLKRMAEAIFSEVVLIFSGANTAIVVLNGQVTMRLSQKEDKIFFEKSFIKIPELAVWEKASRLAEQEGFIERTVTA